MCPHPSDVLARPAEGPDAVARYGDHADHLVDFYVPPGDPVPRPMVVLLHGGFWRQEYDRRHVRPMAVALRTEGYVVAMPEYRRTGGAGGWPETFDDVAAVRERLDGLVASVLPGRVRAGAAILAGHSAGGQLALWWALSAAGSPSASAVVALAPVADLARAHAEQLGGGAVAAVMGGSPQRHPDRYATVDPLSLLRQNRPGRPPVTVLHGSDDQQVPAAHSRSLPGVRYVELCGEHFGLIDPLSSAWPQVRSALRTAAG